MHGSVLVAQGEGEGCGPGVVEAVDRHLARVGDGSGEEDFSAERKKQAGKEEWEWSIHGISLRVCSGGSRFGFRCFPVPGNALI